MSRIATFDLMLGTNGSGKSHILKQLLKINKRNLIIPPRLDNTWDNIPEINTENILNKVGYSDWDVFFRNSNNVELLKARQRFGYLLSQELFNFSGSRKIYIDDEGLFKIIVHPDYGFKRGGLFLDDFKDYIPSNKLPKFVHRMLSNRRFRELDIFAATHSPLFVPVRMFAFNPTLYLFKITDSFERAKDNFLKYDELVALQKIVNERAKSDPHYFKILE